MRARDVVVAHRVVHLGVRDRARSRGVVRGVARREHKFVEESERHRATAESARGGRARVAAAEQRDRAIDEAHARRGGGGGGVVELGQQRALALHLARKRDKHLERQRARAARARRRDLGADGGLARGARRRAAARAHARADGFESGCAKTMAST